MTKKSKMAEDIGNCIQDIINTNQPSISKIEDVSFPSFDVEDIYPKW